MSKRTKSAEEALADDEEFSQNDFDELCDNEDMDDNENGKNFDPDAPGDEDEEEDHTMDNRDYIQTWWRF